MENNPVAADDKGGVGPAASGAVDGSRCVVVQALGSAFAVPATGSPFIPPPVAGQNKRSLAAH
jgi:hypothetical protein